MDIDRWILFVSRNGIREFILDKWKGQIYGIPSCLFLCEDITYLELFRCSLIPPASFGGFRKLRTLYLHTVNISNVGLENLISNSPFLNKLILCYIKGCTHLKLRAPNLVHLEVEGEFEDLCFENTPVLDEVSIKLLDSDVTDGAYESPANGATCKLINLFSSLPCIKTLKLLDHTCQILSAGDVPVRIPTSCQLLHLSVHINFEDTQHMLAALCIFRSSFLLRKVDIYSITDESRKEISAEDFWEAHEDFNCLFSQLQILNVSGYRGTTAELKFIEFVLAKAPVLEIVKVVLKGKDDMANTIGILRNFTRFRRMSSKAELIVPE